MVCPCLHFHLACGDEGLEIEQRVSLLDETVDATLLESELFEKHLLVFIRLEFSNVLFGLCSNHHSLSAFLLGEFLNFSCELIAALCARLIDVAHIEHRLGGEQKEVACSILFFF